MDKVEQYGQNWTVGHFGLNKIEIFNLGSAIIISIKNKTIWTIWTKQTIRTKWTNWTKWTKWTNWIKWTKWTNWTKWTK